MTDKQSQILKCLRDAQQACESINGGNISTVSIQVKISVEGKVMEISWFNVEKVFLTKKGFLEEFFFFFLIGD